MKRIFYLAGLLFLVFFLFANNLTYASDIKWIRVGRMQTKVVDSGDQGGSSRENTFAYTFNDNFYLSFYSHRGYHLGTPNWTDENGTVWPVKISGAGHGIADEIENTIPIADENDVFIRKYMRYQPPTITVDGMRLDEPFPQSGDAVDANKTGTADVLIESTINTSMGLTINQKVLAWSQINHDQYFIYDWTFTNTGNVDEDADIELGSQTLNDVYFLRSINVNRVGRSHPWHVTYGQTPGDTLRICWQYPSRNSSSYNDLCYPRSQGYYRYPSNIGEAVIHADKSVGDTDDDVTQPQMTGYQSAELRWVKQEANINSPADHQTLYQTMQFGFKPYDGTLYLQDAYPGTVYPGTHHSMRMDDMGIKWVKDFQWFNWRTATHYSVGPYTLQPGENFRIVMAEAYGVLSLPEQYRIGTQWYDHGKEVVIDPPPGMVYGVTDNLPNIFHAFPDLMEEDKYSTAYNNWSQNCWLLTAKDSLFNHANSAQWNLRNNYNIPIAPPPPSIEVKSLPDKIRISWGTESESASDFAGYRIYRAVGSTHYSEDDGEVEGLFEPIFEVTGSGTHEYDDVTAERGVAYYYYVTGFDDGIGNITDSHGRRQSLESGQYLNMTTVGAHLTRPPADELSDIRVVPNPFNVIADDLQYPGEENKIMFLDLPGYCTIRIYTESGDLIKVLEHTSGSGDESWGKLESEHSATESGQIIVSGIYYAKIIVNDEAGTPTGESAALKFVIIR